MIGLLSASAASFEHLLAGESGNLFPLAHPRRAGRKGGGRRPRSAEVPGRFLERGLRQGLERFRDPDAAPSLASASRTSTVCWMSGVWAWSLPDPVSPRTRTTAATPIRIRHPFRQAIGL